MPVSTRIYASGALAFGGQPAITDLISARYSTVIIWSVHVDPCGNLYLNDTKFVSNGVYYETEPMGLPRTVAQLRGAGVEILFSVGAGGTTDWTNIESLLGGEVPGPGNILYKNFSALKSAMMAAGGDIDGIDFDNEDNLKDSVMANLGRLLRGLGYAHVTFCPFYNLDTWASALKVLNTDPGGQGFVNAIHLQCYSGGSGNNNVEQVQSWQTMITTTIGTGQPRPLLIPGLATCQPPPGVGSGPWWDSGNPDNTPPTPAAPGAGVVKRSGLAMNGQADWSKHLYTAYCPSAEDAPPTEDPLRQNALQFAQNSGGITFFFYCNDNVNLDGKTFQKGDAVFFAGTPSWTSVPACDAYTLSRCSDIYNGTGACPRPDLEKQYRTWRDVSPPPQGGFIWFYDSVVWCLLSGCCGGSEQQPATTAQAYRDAIVTGLTGLSTA